MNYSERVEKLLGMMEAREGDIISIIDGDRSFIGILMPHHDFSDPEVVVIKLKSGYNVGIRVGENTRMDLIDKAQAGSRKRELPEHDPDLKDVAIIGTGGTIASYVDYRTGAVHPALSTDDLVRAVPELGEVCNVSAEVLFSIFSENMNVEAWKQLAGRVKDRLDEGLEGVIVPHGTDTLGYTSAALSFMLPDPPRPVIMVGAQRSSDRPSSDAYTNLLSAAKFLVETDVSEVFVLMHDGTSDDRFALHRGTRVRKMHTSRRDAFHSINSPPVALMNVNGKVEYRSSYRSKSDSKVKLEDDMEENVCLIHFYPGMSPTVFGDLLRKHRGAVIAGTGLGHVSRTLISEIAEAVKQGTHVVMSSQCLSGRVNLNVYDTGRDILSAGAIPGEDMVPETALVKLMWVLGREDSPQKVMELMLTDLRGEICTRREL